MTIYESLKRDVAAGGEKGLSGESPRGVAAEEEVGAANEAKGVWLVEPALADFLAERPELRCPLRVA